MVLLPLSDDDPLDKNPYAFATWSLIAITILVFFWQVASGPLVDATFSNVWGVVPDNARGDVPGVDAVHRFVPLVTYMFLHGGWLHLFGNMLFLWIFGDNIEDATSPLAFLVLYLASGIAGALLYVAMTTDGAQPMIGASGAVAGVLGAYLVLRPCATVRVLVFVVIMRVRAVYVIATWMAVQLFNALTPGDSEVAWWAHVGGALAGAFLVTVLRSPGVRLFECVPAVDRTVTVAPVSRR